MKRGLSGQPKTLIAATAWQKIDFLHENWLLKRSLTDGISSGEIDGWYDRAMKAGALGGKLLGAGGGGFLLFYARPEKHAAITDALSELRRIDFSLEPRGSRIIFVNQ